MADTVRAGGVLSPLPKYQKNSPLDLLFKYYWIVLSGLFVIIELVSCLPAPFPP